ncbi:MAG TPA: hypothetical protein VFO23_04150 [Steroidobacteraceae bacterium]|nr:hypothetical protein [Steroidobacteraceae bacterium]
MESGRNLKLGMTAAVLMAVAACVTVSRPPGLTQSAEKLDLTSRTLADRSDTIGPPYQPDAHELAMRAHDFRSMVDTASVSSDDVSAQFDLVARSYHKMREDAQHANTQQAFADLEPVTAAYRDVKHDLGRAYRDDTVD